MKDRGVDKELINLLAERDPAFKKIILTYSQELIESIRAHAKQKSSKNTANQQANKDVLIFNTNVDMADALCETLGNDNKFFVWGISFDENGAKDYYSPDNLRLQFELLAQLVEADTQKDNCWYVNLLVANTLCLYNSICAADPTRRWSGVEHLEPEKSVFEYCEQFDKSQEYQQMGDVAIDWLEAVNPIIEEFVDRFIYDSWKRKLDFSAVIWHKEEDTKKSQEYRHAIELLGCCLDVAVTMDPELKTQLDDCDFYSIKYKFEEQALGFVKTLRTNSFDVKHEPQYVGHVYAGQSNRLFEYAINLLNYVYFIAKPEVGIALFQSKVLMNDLFIDAMSVRKRGGHTVAKILAYVPEVVLRGAALDDEFDVDVDVDVDVGDEIDRRALHIETLFQLLRERYKIQDGIAKKLFDNYMQRQIEILFDDHPGRSSTYYDGILAQDNRAAFEDKTEFAPKDLLTCVDAFKRKPDCSEMILFGQSGSGKSEFAKRLEKNCWSVFDCRDMSVNHDKSWLKSYVPVFIAMKNLKLKPGGDHLADFIEDYLLTEIGLTNAELSQLETYDVLFILDGYDEKQGRDFKLYKTNSLRIWWNAKVVYTVKTAYEQDAFLKNNFSRSFVAMTINALDRNQRHAICKSQFGFDAQRVKNILSTIDANNNFASFSETIFGFQLLISYMSKTKGAMRSDIDSAQIIASYLQYTEQDPSRSSKRFSWDDFAAVASSLAYQMLSNGSYTLDLNYDDPMASVNDLFKIKKQKKKIKVVKIKTMWPVVCTLRPETFSITFAHGVFRDYFAAPILYKRLMASINELLSGNSLDIESNRALFQQVQNCAFLLECMSNYANLNTEFEPIFDMIVQVKTTPVSAPSSRVLPVDSSQWVANQSGVMDNSTIKLEISDRASSSGIMNLLIMPELNLLAYTTDSQLSIVDCHDFSTAHYSYKSGFSEITSLAYCKSRQHLAVTTDNDLTIWGLTHWKIITTQIFITHLESHRVQYTASVTYSSDKDAFVVTIDVARALETYSATLFFSFDNKMYRLAGDPPIRSKIKVNAITYNDNRCYMITSDHSGGNDIELIEASNNRVTHFNFDGIQLQDSLPKKRGSHFSTDQKRLPNWVQGYNLLALSPCQQKLAVADAAQIVVYKTSTRSRYKEIYIKDTPSALIFLFSFRYLVIGTLEGRIWLLDIQDDQRTQLSCVHQGAVTGLAACRDTADIFSSGVDGMLIKTSVRDNINQSFFAPLNLVERDMQTTECVMNTPIQKHSDMLSLN